VKRDSYRPWALSLLLAGPTLTACGDDPVETLPGTEYLCEALNATDVVIESDADVDSIYDLDAIEGDLIVCSASELTDITLPALERIGGNVIIHNNENVTTVDMPLLTETGVNVHESRSWDGILIDINPALEQIKMPELRAVHQHIWIADNAAVAQFDLPKLVRTTGSLTFKAMQLTSVEGFASLRTIGNSLALIDNEKLTTVGAPADDPSKSFGALSTLSNDLFVSNNPVLTSIELPATRFVGRRLTVTETPLLETLNLENVTTIGHDIELIGTSLENLDGQDGLGGLHGLAAVELVGTEIVISENAALTSVSLPALSSVGSTIDIDKNDLVESIDLPALTWIGEDLRIQENAVLDSLGIASQSYIGGDLRINSNPMLPNCDAELFSTTVSEIGGSVSITGNKACD
jgi:hypothetical protein